MRSRIPLLSVIGVLALAATANAQVTATATPRAAGKASTVHFVINGTEAPISSRIPSAMTLAVPQGFTFDRAAAVGRCGRTSAALNECPANSEIGTATLTITVFYQGHPPRDVTFNLKMYLRSPTSVLGVTFLAGTRVVPGFLSTTGGVSVRFDPLPKPPVFQLVTYALKRITLNLGVTRRVVHTRRVRVHNSVRVKRQTTVHSLIHNPAKCSTGSWAASVALRFPDGSSLQLPAPIGCRP